MITVYYNLLLEMYDLMINVMAVGLTEDIIVYAYHGCNIWFDIASDWYVMAVRRRYSYMSCVVH